MGKVRTRNKWYNATKLTNNVEIILKGVLAVTFLSVWIPAFVYVMLELIKYLLSVDCGKCPNVFDILKYSKPPSNTVVLEELAYNISPTTICATVALLENTK